MVIGIYTDILAFFGLNYRSNSPYSPTSPLSSRVDHTLQNSGHIPVNPMASLLGNTAGICLLVAILVAVYLKHGDIPTENEKLCTEKIIKRPETTTPLGTVRGINMVTRLNRTIFGFLGIPFAEPPVGNLRFRAPVPAKAWNGTLDASSISNPCPQVAGTEVIGNEDCLHLNVYTPILPANGNSTLLPAIVFIVGGSYQSGSNTHLQYGPDFLLDKDVLLVVPNSRLGALGYLSTGDEVSPGNYGLKDMVEALRWIKDNIQYFGGDPNQVTLFGASSGATSVHLLTLSDSTNGLFHRYITQSGSALSFNIEQPREVYANVATQLGEYLGCPTNTSTVLVECLRSSNASELIIATMSLVYKWKTILNVILWVPTSEPDIEGALLIDSPRKLLANGKIPDIPRMSSVVADEGLALCTQLYEDPDLFEEFLNEIDYVLPVMVGYARSVNDVATCTATLKSYYLNDLTTNRSLLLKNLTYLMGDALFNYPLHSGIQQQLVLAKSPQYFSSFEYRGTFSISYYASGGSTKYPGVAHGDQLIYLFKSHIPLYGPPDYKYSDDDWIMVDTMVQLWTSFAINGTPTTTDLSSTAIWEPYSSRDNYLRIGSGSSLALEMKDNFLKERMKFWDQLATATSWK